MIITSWDPANHRKYSPEYRRVIAVHEAGHAVTHYAVGNSVEYVIARRWKGPNSGECQGIWRDDITDTESAAIYTAGFLAECMLLELKLPVGISELGTDWANARALGDITFFRGLSLAESIIQKNEKEILNLADVIESAKGRCYKKAIEKAIGVMP